MKKTIFAALAVVMMMTACTQTASEKRYVINGTVEGFEDGDTVMLVDPTNDSVEIQVVKDGKFTFTGTLDQAKPVFIEFDKDRVEPLAESAILLEDTVFTVKIVAGDYNNTIEGGSLQRLFNEMNGTALDEAKQIDELIAKGMNPETSDATRDSIKQQVDSIGKFIAKRNVDFIIDRMPSEFSNVGASHVAFMLSLVMNASENGSEIMSELQRMLDAFAEKQPDAYYYQQLKKEMEENN